LNKGDEPGEILGAKKGLSCGEPASEKKKEGEGSIGAQEKRVSRGRRQGQEKRERLGLSVYRSEHDAVPPGEKKNCRVSSLGIVFLRRGAKMRPGPALGHYSRRSARHNWQGALRGTRWLSDRLEGKGGRTKV